MQNKKTDLEIRTGQKATMQQMILCLGIASIMCAAIGAELAAINVDHPAYVPGTTVKVLQLTGDFDQQRQEATLNRTGERWGLWYVDLGYGFEHKGRLYFLFGDAQAADWRKHRDPIAYTTSTDPQNLLLTFPVDPDGQFRPVTIPGISQGEFEGFGGNGISINNAMYVVFTTDHREEEVMSRSVLAKSEDDGITFSNLYDLSDRDANGKFINVAMAVVPPPRVAGLPTSGDTVLIWGSGKYRESDLYLACVPAASIEDKSSLRYFSGTDAKNLPRWSPAESDAAPLFHHPQIGEFSVVWYERVQRWLMLYGALEPRGIHFRYAVKPWEWSDSEIIYNPGTDGYGRFVHSLVNPLPDGRSLSDPMRENEWGGEYCPAMLTRYFTANGKRHTIYFNMATWNPYQVVLMRTDIEFPPRIAASPEPPNISVGGPLELEVGGGANPPFSWYKDGILLDTDPPRREGTNTSKLVIRSVLPSDKGTYYTSCEDGTGATIRSEPFILVFPEEKRR